MSLTIQTRFALDRNHNQRVDDGEVVALRELKSKDVNGNGFLHDGDFEDVYYEYGKDQWLPADRTNRVKGDGYVTSLTMRRLDLTTGAVEMEISITA